MKITSSTIISLILFTLIMTIGCSNNKLECEKLSETECIEHQDICSLCPEVIYSSYARCHTIEFCKNIPIEIEGQCVGIGFNCNETTKQCTQKHTKPTNCYFEWERFGFQYKTLEECELNCK